MEEPWKLEKDLCRCCHAEGSFKNLGLPFYNSDGFFEVYSEIISSTLDINIMPITGRLSQSTFTICDKCVNQVQEARVFKKQVLACEALFVKLYAENKFECDAEIKLEPEELKAETKEDSDDDFYIPPTHDSDNSIDLNLDASPKKTRPRRNAAKTKTQTPKRITKATRKTKAGLRNKKLSLKISDEIKEDETEVADETQVEDETISKDETKVEDETKVGVVTKLGDETINEDETKLGDEIQEGDEMEVGDEVEIDGVEGSYAESGEKGENCDLLRHILTIGKIKPTKKKSKSNKKPKKVKNQQATVEKDTAEQSADKKTRSKIKYRLSPSDYKQEGTEYICVKCEKRYDKINSLKYHVKVKHYGFCQLPCPYCTKVFTTPAPLTVHKLEEHNIDDRFKCNACHGAFNTKQQLRKHINNYHMLGEKHSCEFCDYESFSFEGMYKHKYKHKTSKDFHCKFCRKSFLRKTTLELHERIHTGDRRKVCKVCSQAFVQKASLNYHMSKYHPEVYF